MGDLVTFQSKLPAESRIRGLARELAMDVLDVDTILDLYGFTSEDLCKLSETPEFLKLLTEERINWNTASNTRERVDVKTISMVEEALPKMFEYLHDEKFSDNAKVNLFVALQRGAGIGVRDQNTNSNGGSRVSITINMGNDREIKLEHDITPPMIDGEFVDNTL